MRFDLKYEVPQLALIGLMFAFGIVLWPSAPEQIPMHWNLAGEVDRYGGRFEGLFVIPLLMLGVYILSLLVPLVDPRRANYKQFWGFYSVLRIAVILFLALIQGSILLYVGGVEVDMVTITSLMVGILLIVVGNVIGKARPNWFFGVRTPWTLSSKRSWIKTHRLGGWAFVAVGLLWMLSVFVATPRGFLLAIAATLAVSLWLVAYSYLVWRQDQGGEAPPGG